MIVYVTFDSYKTARQVSLSLCKQKSGVIEFAYTFYLNKEENASCLVLNNIPDFEEIDGTFTGSKCSYKVFKNYASQKNITNFLESETLPEIFNTLVQ